MYKTQKACFSESSTINTTNYYCILFEGLFNTLGTDILGMTTIVPLFLAELGASLTLIGSLSSVQSILQAITPLLTGGFIAAASNKRSMSLLLNGISRSSILLVPLFLLLHFPNSLIIKVFFLIIMMYSCLQSMSGIIWNHLLGDCVSGQMRGRLVGTLFSVSGFITFLSSNLVKIVRDNPAMDYRTKYAIIFLLAGALLSISVLCFIPLREPGHLSSSKESRNVTAYLKELLHSFRNRSFNWLLLTNCLSYSSVMINGFIYLYAQTFLRLPSSQISTLLVIQTLGIIAGGFSTGHISSRFGSKRMLIFAESLGLCVPICSLIAAHSAFPFFLICVAVFFVGFSKSGYMGYQTHLLEIVPPDKKVYHIVCKSIALLPFSLVSTLIGHILQQIADKGASAAWPVYTVQVFIIVLTIISASRLKLIIYYQNRTRENI